MGIAADGKYFVAKGRSIHVYSAPGQYQQVCYTVPQATILDCITTMKDGRIIAGYCTQSIITVHTSDGMTLINTIETCIKPRCITAINNTHVVICQYQANKVCVLDLESSEETLCIDIGWPRSVCYDEEIDCLLVAHGNMGQCVIEQYSLSSGDKIECIAENLTCPSAMTFTGDGMLAVRDKDTVQLYSASVQ